MPGNYSPTEYLLLIDTADSLDELALIEENLKEDRTNRHIDPFEYINLRAHHLLKLTHITVEEARKKSEG
jgi:hypothetical protein